MIKFGSALMDAVEQIEREKSISKEVILRSLCDAMVSAYKKQIHDKVATNVKAVLFEKTGEIGIYREKTIVKTVEDENLEITLKEAKKLDPEAALDKVVDVEVTPADFGRIAAQAAKQVITQRIREAERELILNEYMSKKGTLMTGIVQRVEYRNVIVNIGKTEAIMPPREQLKNEYYKPGTRIRVYVLDVKETARLPQVIVSQNHEKIVQELFELEVPEIEDGLVEIKSISRDAGYRTKLAVAGTDPDVDPVGACIGPRGSRIQTIVNELKNEKIDIIRYSDDPVEYIVNALSPAKIVSVDIIEDSEEAKEAVVVVPDDQLSLAIGLGGQNVRLAHRLTGWKIDIKSLSQAEESGYYEQEDYPQEEAQYEENSEENYEEEVNE
ncbi:MAG: transcription termination factor NusA [Candidatus Gastranaerophilales bacterium]|nr:transcription termination factor NusA [Candidatus Gastranaerophilales bacterium]